MTVNKRNAVMLDKQENHGLGDRNKCWASCATLLFITATLVVLFNSANENLSIYFFTRADSELQSRIQHQDQEVQRVNVEPRSVEPVNEKTISSAVKRSPPRNWYNVLVNESTTYTKTVAEQLRLRAENVSGCFGVRTKSIQVNGLPETVNGILNFQPDRVYRFTITTFDEDGKSRCAGGDYYEVDLHHKDLLLYRARLPVVDFLNGSYGMEFSVPSRFSGLFVVDIWQLFTDWHGMDYFDSGPRNAILLFSQELIVALNEDNNTTQYSQPHSSPHQIAKCNLDDFDRATWQGRWTRGWYNEACQADDQKRYRCLPAEHYWCEEPWCRGPVGRLESNGWSYSAHCSFKILERDEAWKCLNGRWFFTWGDSNIQDTIRNLLFFILEWDLPIGETLAEYQMIRTFDGGFTNPARKDQFFRLSQVWNGHHDLYANGEGLFTLRYPQHQEMLLSVFNTSGNRLPDVIVMNSGLHDGVFYHGVEDYDEAIDFAIQWWVDLYERLPVDQRPVLIYRTTIAFAGPGRLLHYNPHRMEVYNHMMTEKLQLARDKHNLPVKFIDTFDMTFPFHYDLECSDGAHYGRPPGINAHPWYGNPHWYFVDLMLVHTILNIACSDQI